MRKKMYLSEAAAQGLVEYLAECPLAAGQEITGTTGDGRVQFSVPGGEAVLYRHQTAFRVASLELSRKELQNLDAAISWVAC